MSHFDSCQLTLIWLVHITLNYWQMPGESEDSFHFHFYVGKSDILYQLIYRGKTTGLSSERVRWLCDYCQRTSASNGCQFILIQMACKVSISARSNVTFDISLHEVCVRVGGRTLSHNQIFLPMLLRYEILLFILMEIFCIKIYFIVTY